MQNDSRRSGRDDSHRYFIRRAAAGVGAATPASATAVEPDQKTVSALATAASTLTFPPGFSAAANGAPVDLPFSMTGPHILARMCKDEVLAVNESRPSVVHWRRKKEFWLRGEYPPGMLGKVDPGCMSYYH